MEYAILFAALLAAAAVMFLKGLWDQHREQKWNREQLRKSFGKAGRTEYADGELNGIVRYFEKHPKNFQIDDITWNDLNLDEIFLRMNSTCSSAGQEYLYAMLRSPSFEEKELQEREELLGFLEQDEETRVRMQEIFFKIGRTGKYSLYDYMDFLDVLGERKNGKHLLADLLFFLTIAAAFVSPPLGLCGMSAVMCFNITTYLKEKKQIEPYLTSFHYIFRLIRGAEELSKIQVQQLEDRLGKVRKLLPQFGKLNRSASLGMRTSSGDPMGIVADYINMMLHLDIIGFNIMLHAVRKQTENIDRLVTIVGELDALIAAAGFRHSLPAWCVPKLTAAEAADGAAHGAVESSGLHFAASSLQLEQLYHPLLADPVKNDIKTTNGVLLTGSNASGKSTFLKAVALNMILAQTIHTCCADRCQSSYWRVMTSMALRDDLGSGESYYIVEIRSLKRILDAAQSPGAPVLCFVDEVLRGTNTVERIAASTQILKSLHKPGVCCFAATHDVELTGLLETEYDNYHFEEQIADGDISFPYLLMPGRATSRNAIRLLEMMGYSEEIIKKADDQAAEFLKTGVWKA